jgi:hypothetical protein
LSTHDERNIIMNDREIQQATSRRDAARSQLFRADGSKVYGGEEHKERERAIDRAFEQELDAIDAEIATRVAEAREQLLAEEHSDPATSLSTSELERAGAMHAFIAEDAENISNAALIERARAALASKDKPRMYVLQHVAAQRLNRNPDSDLGGELLDVAGELRAGLDPEAESRLEVAKADLEDPVPRADGPRRGDEHRGPRRRPRPSLLRLLDRDMSEAYAVHMAAPTNGDRPVPRRLGTRSMLPSTWLGRALRVEYVGADGKAVTTTGTLADWCPVGPILHIAGSRCAVAWERLVLIELSGD